jgi:hypothetical protein
VFFTPEEGIFMRRVLRWCTLAGTAAGLLALTVPASAATGWTVVTPPAGTAGDELAGSYALSDTDAWVVGADPSTAAPVALNWNGTTWSSVPTPTPSGSAPDWSFKSVAASSATDAWAVGEQVAGTKIHDSLYEHWNGTAWSVVSGAYPALSVSADGPNDIWGIYRNNQITHYNGTSWSVYTLSEPSGTAFESVEALSPADVWVAGTNGTGPLIERFNGTSWKTMTTPSSFANTGIPAITARSDSDVWIFGYNQAIANWNGSSWTTSPSPLPSGTEFTFSSAANSPSHIWAFGTDDTSGEPLILSHS